MYPAMYDAVYIICECSYVPPYAILLSLIIFFSLPTTTIAFNASYSAPTQCSPFQITWDDSYFVTNLFVLPLNDRPVNVDVLHLFKAPHDIQTKTTHWTVTPLTLRSGTQFVVAMEYGSIAGGSATFVSSIQTVGDSSNSSCVSTDPSPMSSFFSLDTPVPSTCSERTVSWNTTRYKGPPGIRVLIVGGQSILLDRPNTTASFTTWVVNIRDGKEVVLFVQPDRGVIGDITNSRTSPLITIAANSSSHGDDCLSLSELDSTIALSSTTATAASTITASITALPEATTKNSNTPAILGGAIGGLACIAMICVAVVFYRSYKRNRRIPALGSSSVLTVFPSGIAHAASIRKRPFDAQGDPPSLERSSKNHPLLSKRPLVSPSTDDEQGASSTHSFTNTLAAVAPAPSNPAQALPSPGTASSIGMEPRGTNSDGDDGGQLGSGRARTDGRLQRDGTRENVIGTEYLRHTDAGAVRVVELPPSYNELQPQGQAP